MFTASYFPGSNTCRGFHGYFDEILPEKQRKRAYILKGGPGTGKSTLMKRVGAAWEQQGRRVDYYFCSGDPDSLDAVVSGGCMVMDGTSPHVTDPILPGAADQIINLGVCLDETVMAAHRDEVIKLNRDMRRCYGRAYRYLTGADAALKDMQEIYRQAADEGAVCNLRMELMAFMEGESGESRHLYAQAVTCKGVVQHFASLEREHMLCLDLPFGFDADALLRPLSVHLSAKGTAYRAFMHPLDGKRHGHIATDTHAVVTFAKKGREKRTLPFDEDLLRREHDTLAFNRAAYDLLLHQAIDSLARAKEIHDVIERIYFDGIDYKKLSDIQDATVQKMKSI
ncbi:MAG: AAA family ATPase [Clostridia bacterium]|nr:AAA family ATPase [Clostridia bacterium]